jgi:hypothetical protein
VGYPGYNHGSQDTGGRVSEAQPIEPQDDFLNIMLTMITGTVTVTVQTETDMGAHE